MRGGDADDSVGIAVFRRRFGVRLRVSDAVSIFAETPMYPKRDFPLSSR